MGENHNGITNDLDSPTASQGLDHSTSPGSASFQNPPTQQYSAEYLAQLLKDKKQLAAFPNVFIHLERLIDEEINKVRVSLFQFEFSTGKDSLLLPEADGNVVTMQERVYVPIKDYPDYNFVGRILGPRGMTAKQLEQETGCKIMVRGRGSMRDKKKEEMNRGKPNWEHLSDELHVLIQCEDTENRAQIKLKRAIEEVKKLLVPAPEGEDELKRKQLMELAIINGTYRPANQSKIALNTPRLLTPMTLQSPMRSPSLGAPIILSPSRAPHTNQPSNCSQTNGLMAATQANYGNFHPGFLSSPSTDALTAAAVAQGFFYNSAFDPTLAAYPYAALTSPFFTGDYSGLDLAAQAGQLMARH